MDHERGVAGGPADEGLVLGLTEDEGEFEDEGGGLVIAFRFILKHYILSIIIFLEFRQRIMALFTYGSGLHFLSLTFNRNRAGLVVLGHIGVTFTEVYIIVAAHSERFGG